MKKAVNVRIEEEDLDVIRKIAESERRTLSNKIQQILSEYADEKRGASDDQYD